MTEPLDTREITSLEGQFVEALIAAIDTTPEYGDTRYGRRRRQVEAQLAMPEMQAIRRLIRAVGESTWDAEPQLDTAWDDLPMSVLIWAEEAR